MTSRDLRNWTPRPKPQRKALEGRYCSLEPLDAVKHGEQLFEASSVEDAAERFRWLFEHAPASRQDFQQWLDKARSSDDPLFFAVVDKSSGRAAGRQALMRIDTTHGVIEIGSIYWGPGVSRRPAATEALYLFARHAFDELGYRRFEWKCHDSNAPSKRAAGRFGFKFEGVFRRHMVFKGGNRDTAWFSITDDEWPALRHAYEIWLDPANFDAGGMQRRRLEEIREELRGA